MPELIFGVIVLSFSAWVLLKQIGRL